MSQGLFNIIGAVNGFIKKQSWLTAPIYWMVNRAVPTETRDNLNWSEEADLAIVAGGYNSSNTQHLVELCEHKLPAYYISSADKILTDNLISHWDLHNKEEKITKDFIPNKEQVTIMLTCGASCPDAVVESILLRLHSFFPDADEIEM